MFRFYCNECGSIKRVRQIPRVISNQNINIPAKRMGVCDYHKNGRIKPVRAIRVNSKSIPVVKSNRKGGK